MALLLLLSSLEVYDARVAMGLRLANKISGQIPLGDVRLLRLRSIPGSVFRGVYFSHAVV